jgi:hypothetical protein
MKKTIIAVALLAVAGSVFASDYGRSRGSVVSTTSTGAEGSGVTYAAGQTSRHNPVVASGALEGGFSGAAAGSVGTFSRNGTGAMSGGFNVEGTGGIAGATRGASAGYEGTNAAGYETNATVTNVRGHRNHAPN